MKALVIEEAGVTKLQDIPRPPLGAGEVRIAVKHVGLCGTDLSSYRGVNPLVTYPRVPGHEIGAEVLEIGEEVSTRLKIGQRVVVVPYTSCGECSSCRKGRTNACRYNRTLGVQQEGALTEEFVLPAEKLISNNVLSPNLLPLVEPLAVGFHAVARGEIAAGESVVVLGCGMIGMGIIIGAVARGAQVIAVDLSEEKRALAREFGAVTTLDPAHQDVVSEVARLTNDLGADVAFEAVGIPTTFTQAIELAGYSGKVVYVGYCKAPVSYQTAVFNLKELDIRGSRNATAEDFSNVIAFLEAAGTKPELLISKVVPFAEADTAFSYWESNRDSLKIMVSIDE
jgi:2-desacetyl-2-hydroxyethyl bacteriochlorophyllide A dehydrogenase